MNIRKDYKRIILVVISALIYSTSMKIFVDAAGLFPGGFSGVSYLVIRIFAKYFNINLPFNIIYWSLNALPTILVWKYVGHKFTSLSILHVILVGIFTSLIPEYPLTDEVLLLAVFGGILSGFANSLALKAGASSGGVDFIAIYFANKYHRSTWNYAFGFSATILTIAGFLFGWNASLYSIIYQFCNTQIVNLRHDRYKLTNLTIITQHPDEVSKAIFKVVRHGITELDGKGAYLGQPQKVLMMTINSFQTSQVLEAIMGIDPKAFVQISKVERIVGNYYQVPLD